MQHIRIGETDNALIEIPFTTVLASNLQTRILAATLANAAIVTKIKRAGTGGGIAGTGTFVAADDANAPGVRGYRPASSEMVAGMSTFIFTGTNMEPREVPVMFTYEDPYRPSYFGAVIAGTLTTSAFSTDLAAVDADHWKDALVEFLTGANAGAVKPLGASSGAAGKVLTLKTGYTLPNAPSAADKFRLITR